MPLHVLYLDLDGVCHHEAVYRHPRRGIYVHQGEAPGRSLFEWAGHLEDALAPYPHVRIVLSTSWVRALGFSRTVKRLPMSLRERVVGATYHRRFTDVTRELGYYGSGSPSLRGQEVWADVQRRRPDAWVAIDDTDEGWVPQHRDKVVICDSSRGLSDPQTLERVREAFAREFGQLK